MNQISNYLSEHRGLLSLTIVLFIGILIIVGIKQPDNQ